MRANGVYTLAIHCGGRFTTASTALSSVPAQLSGFVDDMLVVLRSFAAVAGGFCSTRIGKAAWSDFIDDLDRKKAISVPPKDVW